MGCRPTSRRRRLPTRMAASCAVVLGLFTLGGCSSACTTAGGVTGHRISLSPDLLPADAVPTFRVLLVDRRGGHAVCEDDAGCEDTTPPIALADSRYVVPDDRLNGPDTVSVALQVLDARAITVADGRFGATVHPIQPNGPDCGTFWLTDLAVDATGGSAA